MFRSLIIALIVTTRLYALDILVSGRFSNSIVRYDGDTGAFKGVFASGGELQNPNGLAFGPDGRLYAGLGDTGVVLRYDGKTGAFIDRFIDTDAFQGARDIVFGPDGDLYVAAGSIDRVLRFDGKSGALKGVAAQSDMLQGPVGLDIRSDGLMVVGGALSNGVYFFRDGQLQRGCSNRALHGSITGVLFGADGFVYAATAGRNSIVRVNPETCAETVFATGGGLNIAIYLAWGPDGNLLAGSFNGDSVVKFDRATGAVLGTFVMPQSGGLDGAHDIVIDRSANIRRRAVRS
jgi:glucose/arabinose dehydrogenase